MRFEITDFLRSSAQLSTICKLTDIISDASSGCMQPWQEPKTGMMAKNRGDGKLRRWTHQ